MASHLVEAHIHGPPWALGPAVRQEYDDCPICQAHLILEGSAFLAALASPPRAFPAEEKPSTSLLVDLTNEEEFPNPPSRHHPYLRVIDTPALITPPRGLNYVAPRPPRKPRKRLPSPSPEPYSPYADPNNSPYLFPSTTPYQGKSPLLWDK